MVSVGNAQEFGGNSASLKWLRIRQPKIGIIFPDRQLVDAQRVTAVISRINQLNDSSIGSGRKFLPIVLQPETTVSNGYVTLAPFHSAFMLTAPASPFDQGSIPWAAQLALHEYRHAEQYSNFNRGLARVFSIILGQQGQAFANALSIPDWFFEGDAVYQETLLSTQGRGRLAGFFDGYRSLWEAHRVYSFAKLRNGSLKDFVPGHYDLGYQLVAYGRAQYGADLWRKVAADAAATKGVFYSWQKAVKKYTGLHYDNFVQQALSAHQTKLGIEVQEQQKTAYADELNPVYTEKGNLLYTRSSYSQVAAFYEKTANGTRRIRTRDRSTDNYFSYANGSIVYASYTPSLRRGWKDYSDLQLLNVATGRQKTITRRSKYFSASLSPTGDSIITVFNRPGEEPALHLLNKEGHILKSIAAADGELFYHPVFAAGKIVASIRRHDAKMALVSIDLATGARTMITGWLATVIGYPRYAGGFIYFTAADQGRDQLFRVTVNGTGMEKLFAGSSQTGQYQPAVYGDSITWMQFTANGTRLLTRALAAGHRLAANSLQQTDPLHLNELLRDYGVLEPAPPAEPYEAEKYPKSTALLNVHSWLPWFDGEAFSLSFMSQNILNTLQSDLYLGYNRNEGYKKSGLSGSYGAWFPVITAGISYTVDRRAYQGGKPVYWNEVEVPVGVQVPLNLSRRRSIRYLTAYSNIVFKQVQFQAADRDRYGSPAYQYLDNQVLFSNQVQQARQQFNPPFAQSLRLHYRNAISRFASKQLLLAGSFYFPGLFKNHSLVLSFAAQGRDSSNGLLFSNEMAFARGYYDENFFRATKAGVNYAFPLCYPDVGVFQVVYLLRLRANVYYDHSMARDKSLLGNTSWHPYRSTGLELMADTKWWNQLPLSFGIRYARLLDDDIYTGNRSGRNRFEFIIPLSILPGSINKQAKLLP
ncbi:MAG: hypothetical protein QM664_05025 [Flavihumibacter sp.]